MESAIIRVIYITMFALLSIVLYLVIIPSKQEFPNYTKARRILGFAFMMIAVMETLRLLFPPAGLKRFMDFAVVVIFSMIFTSLNFVSFLYMLESSRVKRKQVKKTAVLSSIMLLALGVTGYIFVDIRPMIKMVMLAIYFVICVYEFTQCVREYDRFILHMDQIFEERINISWMYQMLWMTAVAALIMGMAFFRKEVYIISGTISVIVYTILTVKILSFVPANIVSIRKKIDETKEEGLIIDDDEEELACEQTPAPVHSIEEKKGYAKIEPLVRKWVEEERYTQAELNIKDAASQMGTNSNYLSLYINKELNTSFATWLNTLRIEKSKEFLMDERRISIEECGVKVGYPNIYNFSRWFKIVTGMSPSEWRKLQ